MLFLFLRLNKVQIFAIKLKGFLVSRLKSKPDTVLHPFILVINTSFHHLKKLEIPLNFETVKQLCCSLLFAYLPDAEILLGAKTHEGVGVGQVPDIQHCFAVDCETTVELVELVHVEEGD